MIEKKRRRISAFWGRGRKSEESGGKRRGDGELRRLIELLGKYIMSVTKC